jgi:choline dehydrogenase
MKMASRNAILFGLAIGLMNTAVHAGLSRDASQLRDDYDFIIAGAGTSGLTVADRVTAAFPNSNLQVAPIAVMSR